MDANKRQRPILRSFHQQRILRSHSLQSKSEILMLNLTGSGKDEIDNENSLSSPLISNDIRQTITIYFIFASKNIYKYFH